MIPVEVIEEGVLWLEEEKVLECEMCFGLVQEGEPVERMKSGGVVHRRCFGEVEGY